ncbi:hypothetical protein H9P43_004269 [Blastocladiella emersonii ATCC 22665]|nr:hypothetical protein H9P43_004269 [Blastocladiella emersonii ATCC 22665]
MPATTRSQDAPTRVKAARPAEDEPETAAGPAAKKRRAAAIKKEVKQEVKVEPKQEIKVEPKAAKVKQESKPAKVKQEAGKKKKKAKAKAKPKKRPAADGDESDDGDYDGGGGARKTKAKQPAAFAFDDEFGAEFEEFGEFDEDESGASTRLTMPNPVVPVPVPADHVKIVSWNVNSITTALERGFIEYLDGEQPDVVCLQGTKISGEPEELSFDDLYPYQFWSTSTKSRGYSGSAILSKLAPVGDARYGLPDEYGIDDARCRVMTLEFAKLTLVSAYAPNAGMKNLQNLDDRREWNLAMEQYLAALDAVKPVVYCGGQNVAHEEIDLSRPKQNEKTAGHSAKEREDMTRLLDEVHLVDVWRHQHPGDQRFSYFGYRNDCRSKGIGWRLDSILVSERLVECADKSAAVGACTIRDDCWGASDHVPLVLTVPRALFEASPAAAEE